MCQQVTSLFLRVNTCNHFILLRPQDRDLAGHRFHGRHCCSYEDDKDLKQKSRKATLLNCTTKIHLAQQKRPTGKDRSPTVLLPASHLYCLCWPCTKCKCHSCGFGQFSSSSTCTKQQSEHLPSANADLRTLGRTQRAGLKKQCGRQLS